MELSLSFSSSPLLFSKRSWVRWVCIMWHGPTMFTHTFVALSFSSLLRLLNSPYWSEFLSFSTRKNYDSYYFWVGAYVLIFFQFPGGLPPGMPGLPPGGPRIDLPVSLGSNLAPPRGSDPLMSLGPSAPGSSGPHNSGPGMRAPNSNDKVTRLYFSSFFIPRHLAIMGNPVIFAFAQTYFCCFASLHT